MLDTTVSQPLTAIFKFRSVSDVVNLEAQGKHFISFYQYIISFYYLSLSYDVSEECASHGSRSRPFMVPCSMAFFVLFVLFVLFVFFVFFQDP